MYVGPGGAFGLVVGFVAHQASKATRKAAENRRLESAIPRRSPATYAANHALNVEESKLRWARDSRSARFALVRDADADASETDDSVFHLAAE
jgi:hypothetical protein